MNFLMRFPLPFLFLILLIPISFAISAEGDPSLKIGSKAFSLSELLKRPDVEQITIEKDPAYGKSKMQYKTAIKARNLFVGVNFKDDAVIQFKCTDGFANQISKDRIMASGESQSIAYIALEDPQAKWPLLSGKKVSAGSFYLVWVNPERSGIVTDEWPYQLEAFEVKGSLQELYPKIFPANVKDLRVTRGLQLFQRTCFACHTVNNQGASHLGPDLNVPMNPTEYFQEPALKKYIRDPKSLRSWSESKMPSFGKDVLSDEDIDNLVSYLKAMAKEKVEK